MPNLHSRSELPVELDRDIFEIAAFSSKATARTLVCVSKDIHAWILPFLFHNVVIEESSQLKALIYYRLRYGGDKDESMLHCIHRLAIGWDVLDYKPGFPEVLDMLRHIFRNGTALRSLLIRGYLGRFNTAEAIGRSTSINEIYCGWSLSFGSFSNITHLHMQTITSDLSLPHKMHAPLIVRGEIPRLSCVSFFDAESRRCNPLDPLSLRNLVSGLLCRPAIRIAVVTLLPENPDFDVETVPGVTMPLRQDLETIADPRFCLLSEDNTNCTEVCMKRWDQGSQGGKGFWEEMEEVVDSRRRVRARTFEEI